MLQATFDFRTDDFSAERPSLGLSAGINSAALLCYLATEHPASKRPRHLLLYYAHLREHSPESFRFVAACVRYARRKFPAVEFGMHRTSLLEWMEREKFIPNAAISPCSEHLKVDPMIRWSEAHGATVDLIGFVRHERRRIAGALGRDGDRRVRFPIAHLTEADCFALVDREVGWHPPIYNLRDSSGRRLFQHNNCLPCKNMKLAQIRAVAEHYPKYWARAEAMAERLGNYWGRAREYVGDPCASCVFD
jgi:hypothetical protein